MPDLTLDFGRLLFQEDIGMVFCSGLSSQYVRTTVCVWVTVLRKGINDFIQTWIATNMRSYLKKKIRYISTLRIGKKKNRRNGLENNLIARKYSQKRLFHNMGYDSGNLNN